MLYTDVRPILAAKFNKEYGTKFTFDELNVASLEVNKLPDMAKYNTLVTLEHAGYELLSIFYNRGNLIDAIPTGIDILIPDSSYDTVVKILPLVMRKYDLGLTADDIVDAPVPYSVGSIDVTIKPDINFSVDCKLRLNILIGQVAADCKQRVDLTYGANVAARPDIFQNPLSSPISSTHMYGSESSVGYLLTSQVDYTPIAHILKNIIPYEVNQRNIRYVEQGRTILSLAIAAIGAVDGNDYCMYNSVDGISLSSAIPAYNGPVDGLSAPYLRYTIMSDENRDGVKYDTGSLAAAFKHVRSEFTHVLILEVSTHLSAASSIGYRIKPSFLICHYNLGK